MVNLGDIAKATQVTPKATSVASSQETQFLKG